MERAEWDIRGTSALPGARTGTFTQVMSRALPTGGTACKPSVCAGRCENPGWGRVRGWPAECAAAPLHRQARFAFPDGNGRWPPLTAERLRRLRSVIKGQAGACPDRTRAIPCTVRALLAHHGKIAVQLTCN